MRTKLLIIAVSITVSVFGQGGDKAFQDTRSSLSFPVKLAERDLYGEVYRGLGFCHSTYILEQDRSLKEISGCCLGDSVVGKGTWTLTNGNTLALITEKNSLVFAIASYRSKYYFIPAYQQEEFLSALEGLEKKFKRILKRKGEYAAENFMDIKLFERYYCKRI